MDWLQEDPLTGSQVRLCAGEAGHLVRSFRSGKAVNIKTPLVSCLASKVRLSRLTVTNFVCYQHFHFARLRLGVLT